METTASAEPSTERATARTGGSGRELDLLIAGALLLQLVAYLPGFSETSVALRTALALPFGAVGLVVVADLAWRGDRPARWALAFVAWMGVAALFADQVALSLVSGVGTDRGWVFLAAFVGWFGLGRWRHHSAAAPVLVDGAIVVGCVLNAALAIGQGATFNGGGLMASVEGRALGLMPNPVYLGGLLAGGLALVGWHAAQRGPRWLAWTGAVAVIAAGLEASGTRAGLAAGLVVVAWNLRRAGWQVALAVVAALLVGVVGMRLASAETTTSDRVGGSSGTAPRVEMWGLGIERAAESPITGYGPNRFLTTTSPDVSESFARAEGPDRFFFDAHNVAVEHLVGGGVVGLITLVGFAVTAGRAARGRFAGIAIAVGLTWLLAPVSVATAPLAMVALGMARRGPPPPRASLPRPGRIAAAVVLGLAATVLAGRLVWADHLLRIAADETSLEAARDARSLVPFDPVVTDTEVQVLLATFDLTPAMVDLEEVRATAREAIDQDPAYWRWWYRLAEVEYADDDRPDAERLAATRAALDEALARAPMSVSSLAAAEALADDAGDEQAADAFRARRCAISACDP